MDPPALLLSKRLILKTYVTKNQMIQFLLKTVQIT